MAGIKTLIDFDFFILAIVGLAFVLASGLLLSILSCALFSNWWPLTVVFTYVLASLPNPICSSCSQGNDLLSDRSPGFQDVGKFLTSVFVVSGFGLPIVLNHSGTIEFWSAALSIMGGALIYSSIIAYSYFFQLDEQF